MTIIYQLGLRRVKQAKYMQSKCNENGVLSLIVLKTLADLAPGYLSDFSSTITPLKTSTWLFLKYRRNIPTLEGHNVSSLCLEWSSPTHVVHDLLHYFLQTSAQMPYSLTGLFWPSHLNISLPHHALSLLSCTIFPYVIYCHLRHYSLPPVPRTYVPRKQGLRLFIVYFPVSGRVSDIIGNQEHWMDRRMS